MKLGFVLFAASILISVVLLNPKIKKVTMGFLLNTQKQVLSQLVMDHQGTQYKILKIENLKGLAVEIYKVDESGAMLLDTQQLTDKKDAFYKFGDKKHNLFLKDINKDGQTEIILPTMDKNMKARLNVFHFDSENERLVKVTKH